MSTPETSPSGEGQRKIQFENNIVRVMENNFGLEVVFNDNVSITNPDDARVKAKYDTNVKEVRALIRTEDPPDDPSFEPFLSISFGEYYVEVTIDFSTTRITAKYMFSQFLPDMILEDVSKVIAGSSVKEFIDAIMKMTRIIINNITEYYMKKE